jgi:lysophospholipase L1-like esterase
MLVVGPATPGAEPTPVVRTTRQGVLAASQRAGLAFADPFREEWFTGAGEEFFSEDGSRLTPAGQERMAERLLPLVREQARQVLRDPSVDLDD